jgi:hypothetical protein
LYFFKLLITTKMNRKLKNIRNFIASKIGTPELTEELSGALETAILADETAVGVEANLHTEDGEGSNDDEVEVPDAPEATPAPAPTAQTQAPQAATPATLEAIMAKLEGLTTELASLKKAQPKAVTTPTQVATKPVVKPSADASSQGVPKLMGLTSVDEEARALFDRKAQLQ